MRINDPRAIAFRAWLDSRHTWYRRRPITDGQLAMWLDDAEATLGVVEIRGRDSVSGNPETYSLDVDE
jgi:hypothetical protein